MNKHRLALAAALACGLALPSPAEREPLWPEGKIPNFQEHQVGAMTDEPGWKDRATNAAWRAAHRMPYVEWYEAPVAPNGACMILVSGGSYECCCDTGLVESWRREFTKLGFRCVNLAYRVPRPQGLPVWQSGWQDGQRAVRLVRSQAKKRGFDPEKIGVIGMSAGGHLVCMLATSALTPAYAPVDALDKTPCHVNICIANAPAYNTANGASGGQTVKDGVSIVPTINPCFACDAKTCPISFHHGGADPWSPNGSTLLYRELRKRKIPAELHLYADRPHGAHGFERAIEFLRQMKFGIQPTGGFGKEIYRWHPDGTARAEKQSLWPKGVNNDPYAPYLVWYVPEHPTTKAIQIVFAGGGYSMVNYVEEAEPVAYYLNQKGMTTVCVKYRVADSDRPERSDLMAWKDAQRAIRVVRSEAERRGLDPNRIGTMGFSAGGHLTYMTALNSLTNAYAATDAVDKFSCSVQWACPIYPAYALTDGLHAPNRHGGNLDEDVPAPGFNFDAATPPMCFVHGDADAWAAMNSVKFWEKLRTMGRQSDLHTLATRGHCFQVNASGGTGSYTWLDRVWDFLSAKKFNR